jgi:sterol desaturase/sphingolipid hydroxylase (fatty acid hydroxylase superfamily)
MRLYAYYKQRKFMKLEELLGLGIPVLFLVLLGFESVYAARKFETVPHWRWRGGMFFVMVLVVGSITPMLLPLHWLKAHAVFDLNHLGLLGVPLGLLAVTFFGYWLHRAEHRFNWLWRASHQLHHSAVRIDMAGAFYTHPVEVILKVVLGTMVSTFLLGLTPLAAASVGLIGAVLSMFQHWNIRTPHWLGYLIPRPESHVLHHANGIKPQNFGDLPLWDMVFGSYHNPHQAWHGQIGLDAGNKVNLKDMLLMKDVSA